MGTELVSHVFVYGTLRIGSAHPQARWLAEKAVHLGAATLPGQLVDLGAYPGLVAAKQTGNVVRGDVFRLPDNPAILDALDRYEGCRSYDPAPHEYKRIVATATLSNGQTVPCWTYTYLHPIHPFQIIPNGDWLSRE